MGYQLLVWEGPRPEDDAAARRECREMFRKYFVGEGFEPRAHVHKLAARLDHRT